MSLRQQGVVAFSARATSVLLSLACHELLGCTMAALKTTPTTAALRLELYSDILLAVDAPHRNADQAAYLTMGGVAQGSAVHTARSALYSRFSPLRFDVATPHNACFAHLGTTREQHAMLTLQLAPFDVLFSLQRRVLTEVPMANDGRDVVVLDDTTTVLNCICRGVGTAGANSVLEHSMLQGRWDVQRNAILSGIRRFAALGVRLRVPVGVALQEIALNTDSLVNAKPLELGEAAGSKRVELLVAVVIGIADDVKASVTDAASGWCGVPWSDVWRAGLSPNDLWDESIADSKRNLWNAALFPVCRWAGVVDVDEGDTATRSYAPAAGLGFEAATIGCAIGGSGHMKWKEEPVHDGVQSEAASTSHTSNKKHVHASPSKHARCVFGLPLLAAGSGAERTVLYGTAMAHRRGSTL